ncbi:hypothetical protein Trco_002073 [Trichoderma cornu-damae]|uniref:Wax synthase domain-containing protein n=1 Tax=Trichoderma cornu-damae TaxID=654480 RepID=A0A9P8QUC4_9HYPO|nr:hypothetical protein Trco_002073 [Trichoderma cornu-damae]
MDSPPPSLRRQPDLGALLEMPIHGLGYAVRTAYSDAFKLAVADGRAEPLLVPFCLLAPFAVPALWLAVPHRRRTWFYHTRWLAMAFVVWSNAHHLMYTSSANPACAYAAGLAATWGTMLSMNLLVWTRPQFDAARVRSIRTGHGPAKVRDGAKQTEMDAGAQPVSHGKENGGANTCGNGPRMRRALPEGGDAEASKRLEELEYVWEPYPSGGGFLERLAWSTDLVLSFRCAGWNWSIPSLPRPPIPLQISHGDKVDVDSIPRVSRSGYWRPLTRGEFVRDRLAKVAVLYLVLDFLSVYMMKDPYFILGPDHQGYVLPPHLRHLPPWLLRAYRQAFSLSGVYAAIEAMFGVSDLVQYWMASRFYPSRAALWQYSSTFGSLEQILDRGLAGWWGGWWHQTFRMQFAAPATYLLREGYLNRGTQFASAAAMAISFLQSGMLHASGSFSSVPKTKPWRAPAFFFLQMTGILLQQWTSRLLGSHLPRPPRALSRTANLLFTLAWLYFTAPLFIDDCSSTGLWLVEPVPVSPLRFLGFGYEGDHWWRWDGDHLPKLYLGETWWQSGIAL